MSQLECEVAARAVKFAMPSSRKHVLLAVFFLLAPCWAIAKPQHDVFWSIHDEAGRAGYLLGTVHSEDPRVLEFTEGFLETLRACEAYAMELVPDLPTMRLLLAYMELPEGESLDVLLGAERYTALKAAVAGYAVPDDRLRRMKPWAAMMTLSLPPPKTGLYLDFSLSLRAAGYGAEVSGLETLEEQLSFLERMSLEDQLLMLDQALAEHDRVQSVHDELVTTYLEGSLAALEASAREEMATLPESTRTWFQEEGIDARNRRMVDNALPMLEQGCVFIAVGALHLPGASGLLTLLREAGYRLEPEPSPFCAVSAPAVTPVTGPGEAGCP